MKALMPLFATVFVCARLLTGSSIAATINFDDVVGREVDITTRYSGLGVTLNAILNPFPLNGPFPAPANLPLILAGTTTWIQGFPSGGNQVAVSAPISGIPPGNAGILISFAFDVSHVSLLGIDTGGIGLQDDESVTLTAYDLAGNRIGQTFSQINNLGTTFDETPAAIDLPNMRYVAFNYTDTLYGFYAMDNLEFTPVPEPSTVVLLGFGMLVTIGVSMSKRTMTKPSDD